MLYYLVPTHHHFHFVNSNFLFPIIKWSLHMGWEWMTMPKSNINSKSSTVRVCAVFKIRETTLVIIEHFVLFPCPFRRKQLLVFWEQDDEETFVQSICQSSFRKFMHSVCIFCINATILKREINVSKCGAYFAIVISLQVASSMSDVVVCYICACVKLYVLYNSEWPPLPTKSRNSENEVAGSCNCRSDGSFPSHRHR